MICLIWQDLNMQQNSPETQACLSYSQWRKAGSFKRLQRISPAVTIIWFPFFVFFLYVDIKRVVNMSKGVRLWSTIPAGPE